MPKITKKKFYAVASGRKNGIYENWNDCEKQVKGFSGARYKSFKSRLEATEFMGQDPTKAVKSLPKKEKSLPTKRPHIPEKTKEVATRQFPLSIVIHFDGGSRGNPGPGGAGAEVVVTETVNGTENDKKIVQIRKYLGKVTNNIAEYEGMLCGLRHAKFAVNDFVDKRNGATSTVSLQVKGDSNLIIQQQKGVYECKSKNLVPLYNQAKSIVADIERATDVQLSFEHVYRKDNKVADGKILLMFYCVLLIL